MDNLGVTFPKGVKEEIDSLVTKNKQLIERNSSRDLKWKSINEIMEEMSLSRDYSSE